MKHTKEQIRERLLSTLGYEGDIAEDWGVNNAKANCLEKYTKQRDCFD